MSNKIEDRVLNGVDKYRVGAFVQAGHAIVAISTDPSKLMSDPRTCNK